MIVDRLLFDSAVMDALKPTGSTAVAPKRDVDPEALILRPSRNQAFIFPQTLDALIEKDHAARAIADVIDALDLRELGGREQRAHGRTSRGGAADSPDAVGLFAQPGRGARVADRGAGGDA